MSSESPDRREELLSDRALFGLEPADADELDRLLKTRPENADSLELAAAAVDLALGPNRFEPMPAALRARVAVDAAAWFAEESGSAGGPAQCAERTPGPPSAALPARADSSAGWWLAVAAGLLAIVGWWPRFSGAPAEVPGVERGALLASADATLREWSSTEQAPGAGGDVVWSQQEQRGFMRFTGLAINDPSVTQYQLWIFDDDQEHPIDGGVFDVGSDGEVIVPIDAKLPVSRPTLFAITIEKPGGVVVSDQERIALVAKV